MVIFTEAESRLRETSPGVFRLDNDPDKHDDRAVALALAAHALAGSPGGAVAIAPKSERRVGKPSARAIPKPDSAQLVWRDGTRTPIRRGSVQQRIGGRK